MDLAVVTENGGVIGVSLMTVMLVVTSVVVDIEITTLLVVGGTFFFGTKVRSFWLFVVCFFGGDLRVCF